MAKLSTYTPSPRTSVASEMRKAQLKAQIRTASPGVGTMRIFAAYEDRRLALDIDERELVGEVRERVREIFMIGPDEGPAGTESRDKKLLTLVYAGADLENHWVLTDVGINQGSTVKAILKEETNPSLYIYCAFNDEKIAFLEKIHFAGVPVAEFRGMVSRRTGLPVGSFRLLSQQKGGMEMFDMHTLDEYNLGPGDTVRLETWDGWNDFLNLAVMGFHSHMMSNLSNDEMIARYQMKVALYIAAHFGHVDLAVSLLRLGLRADEPVGNHPLRQWCQQEIEHIDSLKTPVHEAVEAGQLGVLRSFVHHNVANVLAKDGNGLTPLNIALRKKQKPCASFILTKQWSKVNYTKKASLPLSIYVKMKRWGDKAKDKVLVIQGQWKSSIKFPRRHAPAGALVGFGVQLDGFSKSKLCTKTATQVRIEEDEEDRRKRPVFSFEEPKKEDMTPEQYFKSLEMVRNFRLPRLTRIGRLLSKAADAEKRKLSQAQSVPPEGNEETDGGDEAGGQSPDAYQKSRPTSGTDLEKTTTVGSNVKLPPIHNSPKATTGNAEGNKLAPEFSTKNPDTRRLKEKRDSKAMYLQTGNVSEADSQKARKKFQWSKSVSEEKKRLSIKEVPTEKRAQDDAIPQKRKKERSMKTTLLLAKSRTGDGAIPLPEKKVEIFPKPFIRSRSEDLTEGTLDLYEKYRGTKSRDYAISCLTVANNFSEKPWLQQVHQAMSMAGRGVRKTVSARANTLWSRPKIDRRSSNSTNISPSGSESLPSVLSV